MNLRDECSQLSNAKEETVNGTGEGSSSKLGEVQEGEDILERRNQFPQLGRQLASLLTNSDRSILKETSKNRVMSALASQVQLPEEDGELVELALVAKLNDLHHAPLRVVVLGVVQVMLMTG